jgi:hypothetical protein
LRRAAIGSEVFKLSGPAVLEHPGPGTKECTFMQRNRTARRDRPTHLRLVTSDAPPISIGSLWSAEGEAMLSAGRHICALAQALPGESEIAADLADWGDRMLTAASIRGCRDPRGMSSEETAWAALAETARWGLMLPGVTGEGRDLLEEAAQSCRQAAGLPAFGALQPERSL